MIEPLRRGDRVVLLGGGQASAQAADQLRRNGFDGSIILVCGEPHPPYQRPPLSKDYLTGSSSSHRLYYRPSSFWAHRKIELKIASWAEGIEPIDARLQVNGERIAFDRLLISTGGVARRLLIDGANLPGVHRLRDIADAEAIRSALPSGRSS